MRTKLGFLLLMMFGCIGFAENEVSFDVAVSRHNTTQQIAETVPVVTAPHIG